MTTFGRHVGPPCWVLNSDFLRYALAAMRYAIRTFVSRRGVLEGHPGENEIGQ
jgi:hypothetical protein